MRIVPTIDGVVDQLDRAALLTIPFAIGWLHPRPTSSYPANPKRRGTTPNIVSEVWREQGGHQRVTYGKSAEKLEMALCQAETGPAMPPMPDDAVPYAPVAVNGVMTWTVTLPALPGNDDVTYALEVLNGTMWWQALD